MNLEIKTTADGSKTLYSSELDESYHSSNGAIQESNHVFIKNGLDEFKNRNSVSIFEMGFGTGLNALLTANWASSNNVHIDYTGIEAFPLSTELCFNLAYPKQISLESESMYEKIINAEWNQVNKISENFNLLKIESKVEYWDPDKQVDLIYFDAFGPKVQNELWEISVLSKMYELLRSKGVLVTYCAQGQFKRNLKSLGFMLESLPGPPGKREMTRSIKN